MRLLNKEVDSVINRMILLKIVIMDRQDNDSDIHSLAIDNVNSSQSKMWRQRIVLVFIVVASVGLLVCTGLLIQAYITHKSAYKQLESYSLVLGIICFFTLTISLNMFVFNKIKQKKLTMFLHS